MKPSSVWMYVMSRMGLPSAQPLLVRCRRIEPSILHVLEHRQVVGRVGRAQLEWLDDLRADAGQPHVLRDGLHVQHHLSFDQFAVDAWAAVGLVRLGVDGADLLDDLLATLGSRRRRAIAPVLVARA
jgi:hypothetical protein